MAVLNVARGELPKTGVSWPPSIVDSDAVDGSERWPVDAENSCQGSRDAEYRRPIDYVVGDTEEIARDVVVRHAIPRIWGEKAN